MKRILINGPCRLAGRVEVSGSKNAALPIIFACIMVNGVSRIYNLPDIGDVRVALQILRGFGAEIKTENKLTVIDTRNLVYSQPDPELISQIRASTYLIGACLSRFKRCKIMKFGGCNFSARPIDMHLKTCYDMGAEIEGDKITAGSIRGAEIVFEKKSVGATVNAILLASGAIGTTKIYGFAEEPHIDSLIDFLLSCGARIRREKDALCISGNELHGGECIVDGDMIEAGSYLAAGILTEGSVEVDKCPLSHMDSVFSAFKMLGADILIRADSVSTQINNEGRFLRVTATPYPGFPTDLQPILAPLMAKLQGGSICDRVWEDRFGYLGGLSAFGIRSYVRGNLATVYKSGFNSASVVAPDLRGGMACLMSAMAAEGQSVIYSAEVILRGYESLIDKLCTLGADIKIEDYS